MSKGHSQSGTGCDVVEGTGSILVQRAVMRNTFLAEIPELLAFGVVQLQISADVANNEQELLAAEVDVSDPFGL